MSSFCANCTPDRETLVGHRCLSPFGCQCPNAANHSAPAQSYCKNCAGFVGPTGQRPKPHLCLNPRKCPCPAAAEHYTILPPDPNNWGVTA